MLLTKRTRDGNDNESSFLAEEIRRESENKPDEVLQRTQFITEKLEKMTEEQLTRFEFFIRSHLSRSKVKDVIFRALQYKQTITDEMIISVSGLAKLFVGELIETATVIMKEMKDTDGVQVDHIEEAMHRLQMEGIVPKYQDRGDFFSEEIVNDGCMDELFAQESMITSSNAI